MATSVLLGALVVFSAMAPRTAAVDAPSKIVSPAITLTIAMTSDCATGDPAFEMARTEASRVWSSAGVLLKWVAPADLPYTSPLSDWLVARCTGGQAARAGARAPYVLPIAAIRFVGAQPTNTIVISPSSANALLDRERLEERDVAQRFKVMRDIRLGRMLGRAIAHEIGHFLTQSGTHTPSGLMRATHSVTTLTGESLRPFKVDPPGAAQYARIGAPVAVP
jgi:hypothetical protein